jgi:hypothetical protein
VGRLQIELHAAHEILLEAAQTLDEAAAAPVTAESSGRASVAVAEAKVLTTRIALAASEAVRAGRLGRHPRGPQPGPPLAQRPRAHPARPGALEAAPHRQPPPQRRAAGPPFLELNRRGAPHHDPVVRTRAGGQPPGPRRGTPPGAPPHPDRCRGAGRGPPRGRRTGPGAAQRDRERLLPWTELDTFVASGLWAITVPKALGGAGVSAGTLAEVTR